MFAAGFGMALAGIALVAQATNMALPGSAVPATLASVGTIPVASIALILGVDRFMSEARALTNLIGNGVATIVVSKWEGALDVERMQKHLVGRSCGCGS